jgi:alanyl-tRNA synthetase
VRFATPEEAARLPLRKEPAREGTLRLIEIEGVDLSACGGTHVPRTGGIGLIAVVSSERFKGGHRIEFVCGGRALSRFRALRDVVSTATRLVSVTPADLPGAIDRLQGEAREQRKSLVGLHADLARYRAEELAASAETTTSGKLVRRAISLDASGLKALASAVTSRPGFIVVLVSEDTPALVVVARSRDVVLQANDILSALTTKFGGRGGGKADLAQAGGLTARPQDILDEASARIQRA